MQCLVQKLSIICILHCFHIPVANRSSSASQKSHTICLTSCWHCWVPTMLFLATRMFNVISVSPWLIMVFRKLVSLITEFCMTFKTSKQSYFYFYKYFLHTLRGQTFVQNMIFGITAWNHLVRKFCTTKVHPW